MAVNRRSEDDAEIVMRSNEAPDEMVSDVEERLSEVEAAFPWLKTYVESVAQEVKALQSKLAVFETKEDDGLYGDGMRTPWNPGDENLGGDGGADMEFDMSITTNGTKVKVLKGHVVEDGNDTYWLMATSETLISGSEYAFPTIRKAIADDSPPDLQIYAAYPKPDASYIYRPLGRLVSADAGATWNVDTGNPIMHRGSINLTLPLAYA